MTYIGPGQLRLFRAGLSGDSPLLTSLVAGWKMDEASGTRADVLGTFPLLESGAINSAAGIVGNAASFVTADARVLSVADNAALRGGDRDFTYSLWLYLTQQGVTQGILGKGSGTNGTTLDHMLVTDAGSPPRLLWRIGVGASATDLSPAATVSLSAWHHIITGYDATLDVLFLRVDNGTTQTAALVGGGNTPAAALSVGARPNLSNYLTARVDEAYRWNRILTSLEQTTLWNGGAGVAYPF